MDHFIPITKRKGCRLPSNQVSEKERCIMYTEANVTGNLTKAKGVKEIIRILKSVDSKMVSERVMVSSKDNDKSEFYKNVKQHANAMKTQLDINPCLVDAYTECINILYYSGGEEKVVDFITAATDTVKEMLKMMEIIDGIIYPPKPEPAKDEDEDDW